MQNLHRNLIGATIVASLFSAVLLVSATASPLSLAGAGAQDAPDTPTMDESSSSGLVVHPYLGEATTTSVIIAWAMEGNAAGEVRYSLDDSYGSAVDANAIEIDGNHWYSATIAGLTAHTTYRYKVYSDGEEVIPASDFTFTTPPEVGASQFSFVALGDSRPHDVSNLPSQGARDVASEMARHEFELAIHTGDIVYRGGICAGNDSSWNQYIRAYFDLYAESMTNTPFYPSVGNHELAGGGCGYQGYRDVNHLPRNAPAGDAEEYYSFDWGNAHFIALDTTYSNAGTDQYYWLVDDLQNTAQFWKFVFFHYPAYSSGPHGSSPEVQTYLVPLFETYGVDVVFTGHDHHYERTCPISDGTCTTVDDGGVVYYVTGGGGAPLYIPSGDWFTAYGGRIHHFLEVDVDGCRLRLDTIESNGSLFDSYVIDRCSEPSPTPTATATPTATPTPYRARLPLVLKRSG